MVANRMAETGFSRFPVLEREGSRRLVGMISLQDLLQARTRVLEEERRRERAPVSESTENSRACFSAVLSDSSGVWGLIAAIRALNRDNSGTNSAWYWCNARLQYGHQPPR